MDTKEKVKNAKKTKVKKKVYTAFKCDQCSKQFGDKASLASHRVMHSDATPYPCTMCAYAGKTQKYLQRHIKVTHKQDRKFSCDVCGKSFHYGCKLKDHMRVHTGEKPYKCDECDKAFNASYSLATHKLIHSNLKPFKCSFCAYACRDSSTLRKHQARHMGVVTYYQCTMCDVRCKSKPNLKVHVAEKHFAVDVRRMECDACGKRFKFRNTLVNHIRAVHDKTTKAKCEVCGLVISNKANMRHHMRIHVDQKPFVCTVDGCGKRYKHTSSLKKHIVLHYPDQQFACRICDRSFTREKRMRAHIKTHMAKVKNVECDYCGVRFYNKTYLTTHIQRKHGRKRQKYICDICGLKTTNKPSIVMHIKYGHVDNPLACTICKKKFKRAMNMKFHYWVAHDVDYDVPGVRKKKPKKTKQVLEIKEEPCENVYDGDEYFEVSPKIEPLDEEAMEELNLVSAVESQNKLEDIPKEMIEEFITPVMKGPDEDRRLRYTESDFVDKKSEDQVKKEIVDIMERTQQKIAARALEKARRKYNKLIRRAVKNKQRKVQPKITYRKTKKQKSVPLLEEDFSIDQTIDNKDRVMDKATIDSAEQVIDYIGERVEVQRLETERIESQENDVEDDVEDTVDNEIVENAEDDIEDTVDKETVEDAEDDREDTVDKDIDEDAGDYIEETVDKKNMENAEEDIEYTVNKEIVEDAEDDIEDTVDKEIEEDADKVNGDEKTETHVSQNRKLIINMHQCYVCFKLYQTKEELLEHCKDHFALCNIRTLKKCPLCDYATSLSITTHLKRKHGITVKVPYGTFKDDKNNDGSRYYYEVNDERIKKVEIIPSIKNLNKRESNNIDKRNRDNKNKGVVKNKLVKKGKEWVVTTEKIKINDYLLPKFDKLESKFVKSGYLDRLKELYKAAKKKGKKMLFPCDSCDKVCQTLSALKLHGRKHETNPKPFKPKVWKHKNKKQDNATLDLNTKKRLNKTTTINKENRTAKPKPVVNNHKCDKELINFYNSNIRGGDIEFWQFLKIYNKMERENVNDFEDLQKSSHFGLHCIETEIDASNNDPTEHSLVDDVREISVKNKDRVKKTVRNAFTRVVRLSKRELKRRDEVRRRLREKIKHGPSKNSV